MRMAFLAATELSKFGRTQPLCLGVLYHLYGSASVRGMRPLSNPQRRRQWAVGRSLCLRAQTADFVQYFCRGRRTVAGPGFISTTSNCCRKVGSPECRCFCSIIVPPRLHTVCDMAPDYFQAVTACAAFRVAENQPRASPQPGFQLRDGPVLSTVDNFKIGIFMLPTSRATRIL